MARTSNFAVDVGWRSLLRDLGIRSENVLRRARLPEDLFSRPENGLTTEEYFRFWEALETELGDPLFSLRLVDALSAEVFSPPLFAGLCSADLLQAARRISQYKPLVAPMRLDVERDRNGNLTLSPVWLEAKGEVPSTVVSAELAFLVKLARMGTRERMEAIHVGMRKPPEAAQQPAFEEFFGVRPRGDERPCVTFRSEDAERPFLTSSEAMWKAFEPDLRRRLAELDRTATIAERVRAVLLELLPGGQADIETVAKRLAMSTRTLQRRLEDEGSNFRVLVNRVREELALHYLGKTEMSGGEISFLLGFEDPTSFFRAFREWTGQTPEAARLALHAN